MIRYYVAWFLIAIPGWLNAESPPKIADVIAAVRPSIATIRVESRDGDELGIGTGFVIDPAGLIATNFHVITEGRSFTVEMSSGRELQVLAVEASDRAADLAIIRVDPGDQPLTALQLSDGEDVKQGLRVLAFGNPLGLRDSVVEGIVSAVREIDGQRLIQIAMPIEQGNSGGPLVDYRSRVHGVINMKSAVNNNLGFAVPVDKLEHLRDKPNPVAIQRWVRFGRINEKQWTPLMGARWQQRGGILSARGLGDGLAGRSLCLSGQATPEVPYEIAVDVRLDDESGAAGLVFCSDGKDRHYGFYPSDGRLRLTCFRGPTVYQWQIVEESESEYYFPGQWNRLRVRVEADRFKCYVNGHLIVESADRQLTSGRVGLVKFRDTNPDFRGFRIGEDLSVEPLSEKFTEWLDQLDANPKRLDSIDESDIRQWTCESETAARRLIRRAAELEQQSRKLRRLASDIRIAPVLDRLRDLFAQTDPGSAEDGDQADGEAGVSAKADVDKPDGQATGGKAEAGGAGSADRQPESSSPVDDRLLRGALLIASLDDADIDVEAYADAIDEMADEVRERLRSESDDSSSVDDAERLAALDQYLFKENGFHGGRSEYYHPANSHLHRVIDEREGLPITMSILYMELGARIGLRIEGVGLPGHFVVRHVAEDGVGQLIDVFDRGRRMSDQEADQMIRASFGRPPVAADKRAQDDAEILSRVLRNLMVIAGENRDGESLLRYAEALVAINPAAAEYRMMRAQLRGMTGRQSLAIDGLDRLLRENPPGIDRAAVERLRSALMDAD